MSKQMDEAVKRRVRAGRLLLKGKAPSEVAKTVGAPRQTVYRWLAVLREQGIDGLRNMSKGGRPSIISVEQIDELREALLEGPVANGYGTDLWTLKRVRLLIEKRFGIQYSDVHVWRILGAMGFFSQKSEKCTLERSEEAVAHWKKSTWSVLKPPPARRLGNRFYRRIGDVKTTHARVNTAFDDRWRDFLQCLLLHARWNDQ